MPTSVDTSVEVSTLWAHVGGLPASPNYVSRCPRGACAFFGGYRKMHKGGGSDDPTGMPPAASAEQTPLGLGRGRAVQRRAGVNHPMARVAEHHHVAGIERPIRGLGDRHHVVDHRRELPLAPFADASLPAELPRPPLPSTAAADALTLGQLQRWDRVPHLQELPRRHELGCCHGSSP